VSYFHAGGIDKPLLITKAGVGSLVPRDTWRGQFHAGTSPTTGLRGDCTGATPTGCIWVNWPGWRTTVSHAQTGAGPNVTAWFGGLVDGMRDASGQMYMRNRYYDPATGQFTQTDPIGLAGGLNAHGFAGGDPVSYSDPFGLCPIELDGIPCVVYSTGADLSKLKPETMSALQELAEGSGHNLGISAGVEGRHNDIRHNGRSKDHPDRNNAAYSGLGVDINEIDGVDIGTGPNLDPVARTRVEEVTGAARNQDNVKTVISPVGVWTSTSRGATKGAMPFSPTSGVGAQHQNHLHVTVFANFEP